MAYKLTAEFKYTTTKIAKDEGRDVTKISTHTDSVHLHEAMMDAWEAVVTERMHNGREYTAVPTETHITAYPTLSLRK